MGGEKKLREPLSLAYAVLLYIFPMLILQLACSPLLSAAIVLF